jgi:Mn2+/Fe2+ NRAMP family transporter
VLNGVLAPPLILLVLLLTSDPKVMGSRVSSKMERGLGWVTFAIMAASAFGLLIT